VLLAGGTPSLLDSLYKALKRETLDIVCAVDADEVLRLLEVEQVSMCLAVLQEKAPHPLHLLRRVRAAHPNVDCVLLAHGPSVPLVVEAIHAGAKDVLSLPCNPSQLMASVEALLAGRKRQHTPRSSPSQDVFSEIIGTSPAMRAVLDLVLQVGKSVATILLEGASGTGKELIARAVQQTSARRDAAFIRVNCAALPETLMESELFGHERGAFTGAIRSRPGRFELADKGTLFLDEIGDMSLSTQTKLLRVLQEGEIDRVGGTRTRHVDVRVIAATNVDLATAVREKRFREDLYYRLRVVQIRVPLLRERRSDIPMLIDYFIQYYAKREGKDIRGMEPALLQRLVEFSWPGNVRELKNAIERGVALTNQGPLQAAALPSEFARRASLGQVTFSIGTPLATIERRMIAETLRYTDGDKVRAADILGVTSRTIYRKLERCRKELADQGSASQESPAQVDLGTNGIDNVLRHGVDAPLDSARRPGS